MRHRHYLRLAATAAVISLAAAPAQAQYLAEQVTVGNAGTHLFGGTDADGGIGDWYLSNGVVEIIIDEAAFQNDLPMGSPSLPLANEVGFTGGTIIDMGLVGNDNDQLAQMFTVGGLSTSNFILYDSCSGSTTASSATITCTGALLGFDPVDPADLAVTTDYTLSDSDNFLVITTSVTNNSGTSASGLGGFLDAFIWTQRAMLPFSAAANRGFRHAEINLSNPIPSLEQPLFAAAIGVIGPDDGVMDSVTMSPSGETAYGTIPVQISRDPDGPGGAAPSVTAVNKLFGISNATLTAFGNFPSGSLAAGETLEFVRRIYVGDANTVRSVSDDMITEMASRIGFSTGTLSGDVNAQDTNDVEASVVAIRTAGPAIDGLDDDSPVTEIHTDATGAFSGVVLPEGTYTLEVRAPNRGLVRRTNVAVTAGNDTNQTLGGLQAQADVAFEVTEKTDAGTITIPAKVSFRGDKGGPDPRFGRFIDARTFPAGGDDEDVPGETFGGSLAQDRFLYLADGTGSAKVREGKYQMIISAGPEYTVKVKKTSLKAGKTKTVKAKLKRIYDTPGYLSADFHIHSARSMDSAAAPEGRTVAFAAEGVDVMVSTDHDFVFDYAPIITALGYDGRMTSIVGSEVTSSVPNAPFFPDAVGHINAWPLVVDANAKRDGAVEDEFVAPNFLYTRLRNAGAEVIQYNHVRAGVSGITSIGFFNNIGCGRCANDIDTTCTQDSDCPASPAPQSCECVGYQPDRALTDAPNDLLLDDDVTGNAGVANPDGFRNIDFDVLEVGNGLSVGSWLVHRADWFSLLNQTNSTLPGGNLHFIPGTGVSDSHRITFESAGYWRSYVGGAGDDPGALNETLFNTNVRSGNMVATTGPFVEFTLDDGTTTVGLGETLDPTGTSVNANIRVLAANWVSTEQVRIIVNGVEHSVFDENSTPEVAQRKNPKSQSTKKAERFNATVPITLTEDSWIVVETGAPISPLPSVDSFVDDFIPDYVSMAFTNPIFVDLDGDGFDAPGVSAMPAVAAARSVEAVADRDAHEAEHNHTPIHRITIPQSAVDALRGE